MQIFNKLSFIVFHDKQNNEGLEDSIRQSFKLLSFLFFQQNRFFAINFYNVCPCG